jgi:hypothetical protein
MIKPPSLFSNILHHLLLTWLLLAQLQGITLHLCYFCDPHLGSYEACVCDRHAHGGQKTGSFVINQVIPIYPPQSDCCKWLLVQLPYLSPASTSLELSPSLAFNWLDFPQKPTPTHCFSSYISYPYSPISPLLCSCALRI